VSNLRIYDIVQDDYRDATQVDLDCLQAVQNAYGRLRRTLDQDHATLLAEIKSIRERAGQPNDGVGWQVMPNEPGGI
jgi:hypothetical protein